VKTHTYINDFLYFVVRPDESRGKDVLICCSGVNLERFAPITKGRHGLSSSPAIRGLQIVRLGLSALALSNGATPKTFRGIECAGLAPTTETWYVDVLLIENVPRSFSAEIIEYGVLKLLESIFKACGMELILPDKLPEPDELQKFIEEQCRKYGR
jgi:hypothetical protein